MIMPILIGGFGNILLPLMLCSSDMIFPRLNALSLWLVFNSLIIMFLSMFIDGVGIESIIAPLLFIFIWIYSGFTSISLTF